MGLDGPLVILNVLNFGHFYSYSNNFAAWGLSRGLKVAVVGLDLAAWPGKDSLAGRGVEFFELPELCPDCCAGFDFTEQSLIKEFFGVKSQDLVEELGTKLAPGAVILINADEIFFQNPEVCEPDFRYSCKVYAITTFGGREAYFGLEDLYAQRLKQVIAGRNGFAGIFSIDEKHVQALDPEERFLRYLPDPYRDFTLPAEKSPEHEALAEFLRADKSPVIPVLGKFDHRKGNIFILRALADMSGTRLVVLGERLEDPEFDSEIDARLEELTAKGRAFVHFGYVGQDLFELVLTSGLCPCLPLPYRNHAGSSGLQLWGFEHGIASLTPDFGLMAERARDFGLGEVFRPGDYADFRAKFRKCLETPAASPQGLSGFMQNFGLRAMGQALDRGLLGVFTKSPLAGFVRLPKPREPWREFVSRGRQSLLLGAVSEAWPKFEAAMRFRQDDAGLRLIGAVILWRLGRLEQSRRDFAWCERQGLHEELGLIFFYAYQVVIDHYEREPGLAGAGQALSLLTVVPGHAGENLLYADIPGPSYLFPDFWQHLGVILARNGEHAKAARIFERAIGLAPDTADYYINLSDVMRYAGRYAKASQALDRLEEIEPLAFGLAHKRGQIAFEQEQYAQAAGYFDLEPWDSPFYQAAQDYLERVPQPAPIALGL